MGFILKHNYVITTRVMSEPVQPLFKNYLINYNEDRCLMYDLIEGCENAFRHHAVTWIMDVSNFYVYLLPNINSTVFNLCRIMRDVGIYITTINQTPILTVKF